MNVKELLPIGSVVLMNGGTKKLMYMVGMRNVIYRKYIV